MEGSAFRDWLQDALMRHGLSRRELARRLPGDTESNRRSLRRILSGETNPTDRTREAIQDVLEDHSAPSRDDEVDEMAGGSLLVDVRDLVRLHRSLERVLAR